MILIFPIKSETRWMPVALSDYATVLHGTDLVADYRLKNLSNILLPIIAEHAERKPDQAVTRNNIKTVLHALGDQPRFEINDVQQLLDDEWLDEVIRTNAQLVRGYRTFVQDIDPEALDAYPARELVQIEVASEPYDWNARWTESGGLMLRNRMIALKSDPVWLRISDFGHPHPPFAFDSSMDAINVSRVEAVELELTSWRTEIQVPPCPICSA